MVQASIGVKQVYREEEGEVLEALLTCADPRCGAAYPVLDGIPVVLKDVGSWWRQTKPALSSVRAAAPGIGDFFDALEARGSTGIDAGSLLGTYVDFHYGEFVGAPRPPAPFSSAVNDSYWQEIVGMARPDTGMRYARSLDLGCSVGRFAFELARVSDLVVGIDLDFERVSAAAKIRRRRELSFQRREHGKAFLRVEGTFDPPQNVLFLVGDALDPPFPADSFDLVGALNLLDNVGVPLTLLGQMDALLREGGTILLGTPYEWRTEIADPSEWLETELLDAPSFLRRILEGKELARTGLRFTIEQEHAEVPWMLRGHARRWTLFLSHMMKARKSVS
ncbi:MAG: methyltransferase domain-containing protein [bacterium]|jgi:SAM-dependent methyltransferase